MTERQNARRVESARPEAWTTLRPTNAIAGVRPEPDQVDVKRITPMA